MVGVDVGGDDDHVVGSKPVDERGGGFGGESLVLPGDTDDPGNESLSSALVVGESGLDGADGVGIVVSPDDPVEPHLVGVRGAGSEPAVAVSQFVAAGGVAADELVESLVVKDFDHLVGVLRAQRREDQPAGGDRGVVEAAHAAAASEVPARAK